MWSIISSILGGGITGLIGTAVQSWAEYKTKQLSMTHEIEMRKMDLEQIKAEAEAEVRVVQAEVAGKVQLADAAAFGQSYDADRATYSTGVTPKSWGWLLVLVDAIRGLTRPGLTLYLCALTTWVAWTVFAELWANREMMQGVLSMQENMPGALAYASKLVALVESVVSLILYLTSTAITWWFGSRNKFEGAPPKM